MQPEVSGINTPGNIVRKIALQAAATPAAVAIYSARETVSYAELNSRSNRLAHYLRSLGVGRDAAVGIYFDRSPAMVVAALAVMKAGGAYLPLDPAQPAARLGFMIKDSSSRFVLSSSRLADRLAGGAHKNLPLDGADLLQEIAAQPATDLSFDARPDDLAYIIYTSGSTGEPKGVEIPHCALSNLVSWHCRAFGITTQDRASSLAALGFDASVWEIWPYLSAGASVALADDRVRSDAKALSDWMVARQITVAFAPTAMTENLLALDWPSTTSLRFLLTGADVLQKYPSSKIPFKLINNYGPTENAVVATSGLVKDSKDTGQLPSIGQEIDGVAIYLLDENLKPVPDGEVGELHIAGASLARGYRNRAEMTAARFIANPFSQNPPARMYKTGDLGRRLASGAIAFLGRVDEQVKIRGYRVEPAEVATALAHYEGIRTAVVVAADDRQGGRELIAYVIPAGKNLVATELRNFLLERLPEYMVPAEYVAIASLPLTANGKLDRSALPTPEGNRLRDEAYVAPRTPVEQELERILARLLKLDRVGVNDNFFLLGGHSLLGTQLIARVSETFGVDLTLLKLFDHPSVAGMSSEIEHLIIAKVEAQARPHTLLQRELTAESIAEPGAEARSDMAPALSGAGRRSVR